MQQYLVSQLEVRHEHDPRLSLAIELTSSADPALPLEPGRTVDFTLSMSPTGIAYRFYAYLHEASLSAVADIVNVRGLGHMEKQRRYGTYTRSNRGRSVSFALRVKDRVPAGVTLRPELSGGIIEEEGAKLSGCRPVGGLAYAIQALPGLARSMAAQPGVGTVVNLNAAELGPGVRLIGVSNAGRGFLNLGPDGSVTYFAQPDQTGPDQFDYFLDVQGRTVQGTVTVMVGDPYSTGYPTGGFAAHPQEPYAADYNTADPYGSQPYSTGHYGAH